MCKSGEAQRRFRTTRARVLRRSLLFVNIVDVGPVEQLQAFMGSCSSQLSTSLWLRRSRSLWLRILGRRSTFPGRSAPTDRRCACGTGRAVSSGDDSTKMRAIVVRLHFAGELKRGVRALRERKVKLC